MLLDRKSTRLNSSHSQISYAVFCLKKKVASVVNPDAVVVEGPGYTGPVRRGDVIRAVVFDAGNTLVRMNYVAISRELATLGVRATPAEVQRAEWQARVRLDTEVFARAPGASTESRSSGAHYVRLILEALGVSDASVVEAVGGWGRAGQRPRGVFCVAGPGGRAPRRVWGGRVRLDTEVFARAPGASTESRSSGAHYVRLILEALGVSDASVVEAVVEWRRSYNAPRGLFDVADPVAEPALRLVRDRGLTAGVVSNSNGTIRSILQALGLLPYLAFVLDSAEVGVEKPDPRIFRLAVEQARVAPREAVYVGELDSVDVRGARAARLDAILLDPAGLWGARDCPEAPYVLAAVRLILDAR